MPATVKITLGLMIFLSAAWFLFGILAVNNTLVVIPVMQVRLGIGAAALVCGLSTLALAFLLSRRNKLIYRSTLLLLGLIFLASFMDDLGWVDFILIGVTAVTFGLLIKDRTWYLS